MDRKTIYRFKSGSHMYGLTTAKSDVDYLEVFLPSPEDVLGLKVVDIVDKSTKNSSEQRRNTVDDVDDQRYTLQSYLSLLVANNPNILETLFAPTSVVEIQDPVITLLLENTHRIVCKRAYKSFCGYARSQEHKLIEKRERYLSLGEAIRLLDSGFSENIRANAPMSKFLADTLNSTLKMYKGAKHNIESFHSGLPMGVIYQKIKDERDQYGWRVKTETFETLGYDCKFGSHWIRLFLEAEELLRTGRLQFPLTGEANETIMKVKLGELPLDELLQLGKELAEKVDEAFATSTLPDEPDREWMNTYLVDTMLKWFRE